MTAGAEEKENIVFDIGNVLLSFQPERLLDAFVSQEKRAVYREKVFQSPLWLSLDRGTVSIEEAAERMCEAPGMAGEERQVLRLLNAFPDAMDVLPAAALLPKLRAQGRKLYALSNFQKAAFERVYARHSFFKCFNGMVISAYVHQLKPESGIYQTLLDGYGLSPETCLFLDDTDANVQAAARLRMNARRYEGAEDLPLLFPTVTL